GFHLRSERPALEVGAGVVSGALGGALGISGPPGVLVLQAAGIEQHAFRATTAAFIAVTNLALLPLVFGTGVVGFDIWPAAAVAGPAPAPGTWAWEGARRARRRRGELGGRGRGPARQPRALPPARPGSAGGGGRRGARLRR